MGRGVFCIREPVAGLIHLGRVNYRDMNVAGNGLLRRIVLVTHS